MTEIIKKLKKNPFMTVQRYHRNCPECGGLLYVVDNTMEIEYDGNMVVHCDSNEEHVFWKNPREVQDVLHLNKNATSTNFDSYKDYEYKNNKWIIKK